MDGQESNQLEEDPVALESLSLRPKQKEISKKRQEKPNTSQDVEWRGVRRGIAFDWSMAWSTMHVALSWSFLFFFFFFEASSAAAGDSKLVDAVSQEARLNCNLFLINLSTLPATKDHDNKFTEIWNHKSGSPKFSAAKQNPSAGR